MLSSEISEHRLGTKIRSWTQTGATVHAQHPLLFGDFGGTHARFKVTKPDFGKLGTILYGIDASYLPGGN